MKKLANLLILAALALGFTATRAATVGYTLPVSSTFTLPAAPPGTTSTHISFDSTVTWSPSIDTAATFNLFAHVWISDGTGIIDAYTPNISHTSNGPASYTDVAIAHGEGNFVGTSGVVGVNFAGGLSNGNLSNELVSQTTVVTVVYTFTPPGDDDDDCDDDRGHGLHHHKRGNKRR